MVSLFRNPSTLIILASFTLSKCEGETILGKDKKLSAGNLLPFQLCTTDDECISAINGLCDCANGGVDVSINKNVSDTFHKLFDEMSICTKMARSLPCGIGAGNTCQNNSCVFHACADVEKAFQCNSVYYSGHNSNDTEGFISLSKCMKESCEAPVVEAFEDLEPVEDPEPAPLVVAFGDLEPAEDPEPIDPLLDEANLQLQYTLVVAEDPEPVGDPEPTGDPLPINPLPDEASQAFQYNLVAGKLQGKQLQSFQSCVTDDDCVYANNGVCDCANGGEEVAVHKSKFDELNIVFNATFHPCTKMASMLPCGTGAGITCDKKSNLCIFQPCSNVKLALSCRQSSESAEMEQCMKTACARRTNFRPFGGRI